MILSFKYNSIVNILKIYNNTLRDLYKEEEIIKA
jgi:hypothetical protein